MGKNAFDVLGLINEDQPGCNVLTDSDPKDPGSIPKDGGLEA